MKYDFDLNPLDRRIVEQLQADASISHAELAERVGSTAPSCWRRIRAMEQAGVLTRTVRLADPEKLGYPVTILCSVRLRNYDRDTVQAFEGFVQEQRRVMACFTISGDWDYLLQVIAADVSDYESFLMRTLLTHSSVGGASSHFALSVVKHTTSVPC